MTLRVTVVDVDTGDVDEAEVSTGDYLLVCHEPCYRHHVQAYSNGTHIVTIKGLRQR